MEKLVVGDDVAQSSLDRKVVIEDDDYEVDELEESLLKVSLIDDEENQIITCTLKPIQRLKTVPSCNDELKKPVGDFHKYIEKSASSIAQESGHHGHFVTQHPSTKRVRDCIAASSPTTSSPLGKNSRVERPVNPSQSEFVIHDVCRSESDWNYFVQRSLLWEKVAVAVVKKKHNFTGEKLLQGICFCTPCGSPYYIPLDEDYFPGNEIEETVCPSSTPSQSISLSERIACTTSILQSCELYFVDALKDCRFLKSFKLEEIFSFFQQ
ncbi:hypothetical protein DICVIV_10510 [Dictyocaulus viviparus]|uniref:Uncharacterized protein n=1 Tax=Dictyocaulus viviparus TaxID=29172 RepID=A0A0D8XM53_DICVI|nr:hypothetical protein DICVIV_10510 [Dictyocaulus viviparus]